MIRVLGLLGIAGVCAFVGLAQADTHHDAHRLLGDKLKTNGKHELHTHMDHTAHAHVQGGKIKQVTVVHKTKGEVKVTKYKSAKKHHARAELGVEHHYVGFNPDGATDECGGAVIAFVGWGYTIGNVVIIYWFPVTIVVDGDAGAVVYNP